MIARSEFSDAILNDDRDMIGFDAVLVLAYHIPSKLDVDICSFAYDDESPLTHTQARELAWLLCDAINYQADKRHHETAPKDGFTRICDIW